MVLGLVSGLRVHCSAKRASSKEDSGRLVGFVVSPFDFSWVLLIGGGLFLRTSCHKITHANGYSGAWSGWVVSVSVSPKSFCLLYVKLVLKTNIWSWQFGFFGFLFFFFLIFCFVLQYNQLTVFQLNSRGAQPYIELTVLYQIYFLFKLHYNLSITSLKD